jgi:hypothetical protein
LNERATARPDFGGYCGGRTIAQPPTRSGREREAVGGFDTDHGGDDRLLEFEVAVAEEDLDRLGVETTSDLFGRGDGEFVARDIGETARLESSLSAVSSASAPFTMASARPIASARASSVRL